MIQLWQAQALEARAWPIQKGIQRFLGPMTSPLDRSVPFLTGARHGEDRAQTRPRFFLQIPLAGAKEIVKNLPVDRRIGRYCCKNATGIVRTSNPKDNPDYGF